MLNKEYEKIYDKFLEVDDLIVDKNIGKIMELAAEATDAYLHPKNSKLLKQLSCDLSSIIALDIKYPKYYVFEDEDLSSDLSINIILENYYNAYKKLLIVVCNNIISFAIAICNGSQDKDNLYKKFKLGQEALIAFNYDNMLSGLLNIKSLDMYKKDISLINEVNKYLSGEKINSAVMIFTFKDYRGLWPANKVRIYEEVKSAYLFQLTKSRVL